MRVYVCFVGSLFRGRILGVVSMLATTLVKPLFRQSGVLTAIMHKWIGMLCPGDKNCMGCFVRGGKSMWDVFSGVSKNGMGSFVRDVLSYIPTEPPT